MGRRGLAPVVIAAVLVSGCGCDEASLVGTVFAHDDGSSVISGTVTARGAPEGRQIEIMIAPDGTGARYGVIPDNLFEATTTCGDTFRYEIRNLDAGAYKILGTIEVASSEKSEYEGWYAGGGSVVVTVGMATAVTVGDGETVAGIDFELIDIGVD